MIRTALIYHIVDVCIDRLFAPIEKALEMPTALAPGMMLAWIEYTLAKGKITVRFENISVLMIHSDRLIIRAFDGISNCIENGVSVDFGYTHDYVVFLDVITGWDLGFG